MPRAARKRSGTGLYHVMIRGADGRLLFLDDEDCGRFLDTLLRAKTESGCKLYAHCLMGNHVHETGGRFQRQGDGSFVLTVKKEQSEARQGDVSFVMNKRGRVESPVPQ